MTILLSHPEVMRTAARTGTMVRNLYGKPGLVIGIARSGTAPAKAFAEGADAEQMIVVRLSRPSSHGWRATARQLWANWMPAWGRQLYKKLFFKLSVTLSENLESSSSLSEEDFVVLREALACCGQAPVIVVDDSIDSGDTVSTLLSTIEQLDANAEVIVFALASTLGRVVSDRQLTLVSGKIAHYMDGDLSHLHEEVALYSVDEGADGYCADDVSNKQLFLDLDGTLTEDSFRDALQTLTQVYWARQKFSALLRLVAMRLTKKARLINHMVLKKALDNHIGKLEASCQSLFIDELAQRLRTNARPALMAISRAPNIEGHIVTAALASYQEAVEKAFGLPVVCGSGVDEEGVWQEIRSDHKVKAIELLRKDKEMLPALLLGDTLTDALVFDRTFKVVIIPEWDRTGLSTLLALPTWWRASSHLLALPTWWRAPSHCSLQFEESNGGRAIKKAPEALTPASVSAS